MEYIFFDFFIVNKSKTKFKQELQQTWDLERRLKTWAKNEKNFKKEKSSAEKEKTVMRACAYALISVLIVLNAIQQNFNALFLILSEMISKTSKLCFSASKKVKERMSASSSFK